MSPLISLWFVLAALVVGFLLFGSLRRLDSRPSARSGSADLPIAVVVPARNEGATLPHLLDDLSGALPQPHLTVVVDDHSTDGTADAAARTSGVTVVPSGPLPVGWLGKPWACHQGAAQVRSSVGDDAVLVFLDADVRMAPDALDRLVSARAELGGVVSVQPHHDVPSWREQCSAIFNLVSMMGIGAGTARPTAMFGPVVCCTARDYWQVDGHRSVRSAVTEDVALAHRFLAAGTPIHVFGGGSSIRFRMYPSGWRSLIEGWTKNIATGSVSVPWWRTAGVTLWVTGLLVAALDLARAVGGPADAFVPAAVAYAAAAASVAVLLRRVGAFRPLAALAYPVMVAFFCAVFARSVWCTTVRRKVTWKGRTIELADAAPAPLPGTGP